MSTTPAFWLADDAPWATGPCSPLRWRTLPGDVVEVEGHGVPKTKGWPRAVEQWHDLIFSASDHFGVPANWIAGVVARESTGNVNATGSSGEIGLMQLMPATAKWLAKLEGLPEPGPEEIRKPAVNIQLGTRYLRDLLSKYNGQLPLASAAYNAGSVRCGVSNEWGMKMHASYVMDVIEYANSALEHGFDPNSKGPPPIPLPLLVNIEYARAANESPRRAYPLVAAIGLALGAGAVVLYTRPALRRRLLRAVSP